MMCHADPTFYSSTVRSKKFSEIPYLRRHGEMVTTQHLTSNIKNRTIIAFNNITVHYEM